MTTAIAIRDELRCRLPIIRPLADLIIGYAVCRGDILVDYLNLPMYGPQHEFYTKTPGKVGISIYRWTIDHRHSMAINLDVDGRNFRARLLGDDDPLFTLLSLARSALGKPGMRLALAIGPIEEHIESLVAAGLGQMLRAPRA